VNNLDGVAGRFNIDLNQALTMTAHFTFPDRDWWVLKFVQAAVAAGAHEIKLSFEEDQWLLHHDGQSPVKLSLLDALGKQGHKKQMALCLRAGWQDPAQEMCLSSQGHSLTLPGDGAWTSGGAEQGTRLSCRWKKPQPLTPRLISRLRNVVRLAPARIWLNQDLINDPGEGDRRVPSWLFPCPQLEPGSLAIHPASPQLLLGAEATAVAKENLEWVRIHEDVRCIPSTAYQTLTGEIGQHQLRLVHLGVEIEGLKRAFPSIASGLLSLSSTQGLKLDPSGCTILPDEALKQRWQQLENNYAKLYSLFPAHLNVARVLKGY